MKLLSEADVVLALGTRLGPFGTLPQHGLDYWPKNARIIQVDADHRMLGLVRPVSVGICGDAAGGGGAGGQAGRARAGLLGHAERARRPHHFREERLGKGTGRLVARTRRLEPGHHQPGRRPHASAPHAARAGTGHARACDGVHRHRQYLLGVQQLSALRRTEFHAGGDELRQLRLRAAGADWRQAGPARPSGRGLCGRRRLVHELPGTADLRARAHSGDGGGVPQRPVGCGKKNQVDFYGRRFVGSNLQNPNFAELARAMGRKACGSSTPTRWATRCARPARRSPRARPRCWR